MQFAPFRPSPENEADPGLAVSALCDTMLGDCSWSCFSLYPLISTSVLLQFNNLLFVVNVLCLHNAPATTFLI
jgi:hypothetical protein